MGLFRLKTIKYLGTLIFVSALIFQTTAALAAYSAGTLVSMTNSARAQNGLGALSTNSELATAAYAKAQDILAKDYFAHNSPSGQTPWDFITSSGYTYAYAGENLGIGYTDASELFSAWMSSATHRDNILNPNFREIGIAVISGEFQGAETIVAVQEFGAATNTSEQVASENANEGSTPNPTTTSATSESKNFEFVKDKTEFTPKSIFAGEQVTFKVTITGEVKTLEVQVFDKKFNLLETGTASGSQEKTYLLKQKIENEGFSEVKILGEGKTNGSETLNLGTLEAKKTLVTKNQSSEKSGLIAGFQKSLENYWYIYAFAFGLIILVIVTYFVFRKPSGFNKYKLIASWKL